MRLCDGVSLIIEESYVVRRFNRLLITTLVKLLTPKASLRRCHQAA